MNIPSPVTRNVFIQTYSVAGKRVVTEWPMDVYETFCDGAPTGHAPGQGDGTGLPINPSSSNCNVHWPSDGPCLTGMRMPPQCQHLPQHLDAGASAEAPRCLACGLEGRDVTADWGVRLGRNPSPAPGGNGGDPVMLG